MNIHKEIFRAYDIRGQIDINLNEQIAKQIGKAVGTKSIRAGQRNVAVGFDGRLSSPKLAQAVIAGLLSCGCEVIDLGMIPTPVLYFATHHTQANSAIMITGSHNPPDYNGFKITIGGDSLANKQITELYHLIEKQDFNSRPQGKITTLDIKNDYLEAITSHIKLHKKLKVVIDCGNGVAGVIAPQLFAQLGCEVVELCCEVDGNFPHHHPDPAKLENLTILINAVKQHNADIGLAFDGDADRVGVTTNSGKLIYPDVLLQLFAQDVLSRNPKAQIIFDVKCSQQVAKTIQHHNGKPLMWKTGHSLIKKKMRETGALLGGEMSGHIFFKERWFGFDDGLYSATRLLEILSKSEQSADDLFNQFVQPLSTPEISIKVKESEKFDIINNLQQINAWQNGNVCTLDGIRVDYADGFGLIRASNTTPLLIARFEATTKKQLLNIQHIFFTHLKQVAEHLNLNYEHI